MRKFLPILLSVVFGVVGGAGASAAGLPDSLGGKWVVAKSYWDTTVTGQEDPLAGAIGKTVVIQLANVPRFTVGGQHDVTVDAKNRIDFLGIEDCVDFTSREKHGDLAHIVKEGGLPATLADLHLPGGPERLTYYELTCRLSLNVKPDGQLDIEVGPPRAVTLVLAGPDKLGLVWYDDYLVLSRVPAK